jgi:hypothetical protein
MTRAPYKSDPADRRPAGGNYVMRDDVLVDFLMSFDAGIDLVITHRPDGEIMVRIVLREGDNR